MSRITETAPGLKQAVDLDEWAGHVGEATSLLCDGGGLGGSAGEDEERAVCEKASSLAQALHTHTHTHRYVISLV